MLSNILECCAFYRYFSSHVENKLFSLWNIFCQLIGEGWVGVGDSTSYSSINFEFIARNKGGGKQKKKTRLHCLHSNYHNDLCEQCQAIPNYFIFTCQCCSNSCTERLCCQIINVDTRLLSVNFVFVRSLKYEVEYNFRKCRKYPEIPSHSYKSYMKCSGY